MEDNQKIYGIIAEHKSESQFIWEQKPMTRYDAWNKMREFEARPSVIRVAMFRMEFIDGNENLIGKEI